MPKVLAIAILVLAAVAPHVATACHRLTPLYAGINEYTSIFVGRVTAVHLVGYENKLLGKPDAFVANIGAITITDGSSPVEVLAVVTRPIRGAAAGAKSLALAGCSYDPPKLRSEVLFFVLSNGSAITISREENPAEYAAWLKKLGASPNDR